MTFIKIYYLLHDLPYYAMICYYFLRYDLLWQPILQPTPLPPPPCTFTLTTYIKLTAVHFCLICHIHVSLLKNIQLFLLNVMKNYIAPILKIQNL